MAAMIVHGQQNLAEAKRRYEEILQLSNTAAVAANNLAYIYADEGQRLDDALRLAQTAVQHLPDNAAALDTLGWVYYQQELPGLAVRQFEQSIKLDAQNAGYHYHLGLAHARNGDVARARAAAEKALSLQPGHADAQRLLATLKP
jgi:tetratricopeptide (TPR) repeat protein